MSGVTVREYKTHALQKEYARYSKLMVELQTHILNCYEYSVINVNDKNFYLKALSDQLRQMNTRYNICATDLSPNDLDQDTDTEPLTMQDLFPMIDLSQYKSDMHDAIDQIIDTYRLFNRNSDLLKSFENPFEETNEELLKIGEKIGFNSVDQGLELILGDSYQSVFNHEDNATLTAYNSFFIPIKFSVLNITDNNVVKFKKVTSDIESLIDNMAELKIVLPNKPNTVICFRGHAKFDNLCLAVRTSQLCHSLIYHKKKQLEILLKNREDINEKFRSAYVRNAGMIDIMGLSEDEFMIKVDKDYAKHRRLVGCPFMNMMKEFQKDSIQNMYDIIRLLLYKTDNGNTSERDDNANVAGLFFGLTKDRKVGNETVANIIYRHLSHTFQVKLRKTSVNLKTELDKIKSLSVDDVDIKKQIALCKNMPEDVKRICLDKAEEMKASNNDYYKQQLYVRTLLNYPWPSKEQDSFFEDIGKDKVRSREFLDGLVKKLNDRVFGHKDCKNKIRELLGKWLRNPSSSGGAIGLVGPPGVGKTLLAKGIGDALGIPFVQITLGGQNDGEFLVGHGYTYSSAQPGLVIKRMVEAGNARCVMYFDELDKTSEKHRNDEIQNILIHMTDPNTNNEYTDRFFGEIKFPLNKVIFIFSYNDSEKVDPTLLNRIDEIEVKPYSIPDKVNISRDYMIKEISKTLNYEFGAIKIPDEQLELLANEYVNEPGVRELRRKIESLFLKMNIDRIYEEGAFAGRGEVTVENPIIVDKEMLEKYLDKPKVSIEKIHDRDMVGIVNGLYATTIGKGGIIPIQIYCNKTEGDSRFRLHMTGSQGKTMKESVQTALTAAMNYVNPEIVREFVKNNPYGFHVHTPSGGVEKNGPSGGSAFTTSFVSRILGKPFRHDFAMTGEIELNFRVTKIGGLQYKLIGAKKAGVTTVLVSDENADDLEEIRRDHKELFSDGKFEVKLVHTLVDVLRESIVGFEETDLNQAMLV